MTDHAAERIAKAVELLAKTQGQLLTELVNISTMLQTVAKDRLKEVSDLIEANELDELTKPAEPTEPT